MRGAEKTMPFCTECGARIEEASDFCTECGARILPGRVPGAPVSSSPPDCTRTADATELSGTEAIVQVIPNLMRVRGLGFLFKGPVWHHMVVTSRRIIIVQKTLKGLDRFKQDIGIIGPDYEYIFMKSMKAEVILGENPESQVIQLSDLMQLKVTKFSTYSAEEGTQYYWQVEVTTSKRNLTLRTDYHEDPGEYFRNPELCKLLGPRLLLQDM
jgi:hypothetical protein